MKKLISVFLLVSLSLSGYCQRAVDTTDLVTIVSPNRDTLIIKDSPFGRDLYHIWINDPTYTGKDPVIILTASITPYLGVYSRNKKKRK